MISHLQWKVFEGEDFPRLLSLSTKNGFPNE
jgi:hypothetical protein